MANHKSAVKRARQNPVRAARNIGIRSSVKTAVKGYREALEAGDLAAAETQLKSASRALRGAASKGVMHKATASRRVSRLVLALNAARG